jgi:hypothetical protein
MLTVSSVAFGIAQNIKQRVLDITHTAAGVKSRDSKDTLTNHN